MARLKRMKRKVLTNNGVKISVHFNKIHPKTCTFNFSRFPSIVSACTFKVIPKRLSVAFFYPLHFRTFDMRGNRVERMSSSRNTDVERL